MSELNKIYCEDCLETMKRMPDNFVDSIVTDPPYNLTTTKRWGKDNKFSKNQSDIGKRFTKGFMGKKWDGTGISFNIDLWKECLRVLKPGGHLLSFGGTRTYHRMACAIEDAGFEIRDQIQWIYGSGFPKSLDIGKAMDENSVSKEILHTAVDGKKYIRKPSTPEAQQWEGWGTALKPANEPICLARKPLSEKIVAENVLKWGTGGINVDGCRIETDKDSVVKEILTTENTPQGRFPANVIHDGSDEVLAGFPNTKNGGQNKTSFKGFQSEYVSGKAQKIDVNETKFSNDSGSAARFFYCAKASKAERDAGCEGIELKDPIYGKNMSSSDKGTISNSINPQRNNHPTVKPIALMRYLCRLITPPKGIVYDPFIGSGTTGIAAGLEGFNFIGSEIEKDSCRIAEKRIAFHRAQLKLQYE